MTDIAQLHQVFTLETQCISDTMSALETSTGRQLIEHGAESIKFILCHVPNFGVHDIAIMQAISGYQPEIAPEDQGYVPLLQDLWLQWGRQRGYC